MGGIRVPRFKPGDKVLIRNDLRDDTMYAHDEEPNPDDWDRCDSVNEDMEELGNQVATIVRMRSRGSYAIDIDDGAWHWRDDMFEYMVGRKLV